MCDRRVGDVRRVHVVAAAAVVRFPRAHGANDREFVHDLRGQWHVLGNLQIPSGADRLELPAVLRALFQIPDVNRRRAAAHPHQDAGFLLLLHFGRMGLHVADEVHGGNGRRGSCHVTHKMPAGHVVRNLQ